MKILKSVLFFLLLINLVSCIEITEEITVNEDKSGKVAFSLNLGSLGSFAQMLGNYMEGTSLDQLKALPEKGAALLKDITGISEIKPKNSDGLISLSFKFTDTKALNSALYKLFHKKKSLFDPGYLTVRKHKLIKKNYGAILRLFAKKYESKIKDKAILKMITYKSVYVLPSEVKKVSNPLSIISEDKKRVEFSCTIQDLLTTPVDIGNKIKF